MKEFSKTITMHSREMGKSKIALTIFSELGTPPHIAFLVCVTNFVWLGSENTSSPCIFVKDFAPLPLHFRDPRNGGVGDLQRCSCACRSGFGGGLCEDTVAATKTAGSDTYSVRVTTSDPTFKPIPGDYIGVSTVGGGSLSWKSLQQVSALPSHGRDDAMTVTMRMRITISLSSYHIKYYAQPGPRDIRQWPGPVRPDSGLSTGGTAHAHSCRPVMRKVCGSKSRWNDAPTLAGCAKLTSKGTFSFTSKALRLPPGA